MVHQDGTKIIPVYMHVGASVCISDLNVCAHVCLVRANIDCNCLP